MATLSISLTDARVLLQDDRIHQVISKSTVRNFPRFEEFILSSYGHIRMGSQTIALHGVNDEGVAETFTLPGHTGFPLNLHLDSHHSRMARILVNSRAWIEISVGAFHHFEFGWRSSDPHAGERFDADGPVYDPASEQDQRPDATAALAAILAQASELRIAIRWLPDLPAEIPTIVLEDLIR